MSADAAQTVVARIAALTGCNLAAGEDRLLLQAAHKAAGLAAHLRQGHRPEGARNPQVTYPGSDARADSGGAGDATQGHLQR